MHINYFALTPHVNAFFHFLEVTPVAFHIEGEGLTISEIKLLHLNTCVQVLKTSTLYLCLDNLNVLYE